ncbi:hypothetical protein F5Y01DRAFT_265509 [Xylaria sp. FL0043]|nr:hypothetical protein F5Y01DRAFT_265509 [Xylaria sp. FL0043]
MAGQLGICLVGTLFRSWWGRGRIGEGGDFGTSSHTGPMVPQRDYVTYLELTKCVGAMAISNERGKGKKSNQKV